MMMMMMMLFSRVVGIAKSVMLLLLLLLLLFLRRKKILGLVINLCTKWCKSVQTIFQSKYENNKNNKIIIGVDENRK